MPRLLHRPPKYRRHKASGQAVVTIAGKDHYLGVFNSKASKLEYDRLVGEWLAAGWTAEAVSPSSEIKVTEVVARFWTHAEKFYRKTANRRGQRKTTSRRSGCFARLTATHRLAPSVRWLSKRSNNG